MPLSDSDLDLEVSWTPALPVCLPQKELIPLGANPPVLDDNGLFSTHESELDVHKLSSKN